MLLVMLAVGIAFTLGMNFIAKAAVATSATSALYEHARAQQIAESGVFMAIGYLEQTPGWRSARTNGLWVNAHPIAGGNVSIWGDFTTDPLAGGQAVDDPSFEVALGELANPLLAPPMSGAFGGWQFNRTALVHTGATVPRIGVRTSAAATDGSHLGIIQFPLSVTGSGTISQTLAYGLIPDADYALTVDVGRAGLALLLPALDIRIYAGATLMASSTDVSLLTLLDIDGDFAEHALRFSTGGAPPPGLLRIELHASSLVGLLTGIAFDNVSLEIEDRSPVVLTSVGAYGDATHKYEATVICDSASKCNIVRWAEP